MKFIGKMASYLTLAVMGLLVSITLSAPMAQAQDGPSAEAIAAAEAAYVDPAVLLKAKAAAAAQSAIDDGEDPAAAAADAIAATYEPFINGDFILTTTLFLVAGFLVFWMAAGFAMLEAGLVRSKNVTM